MMGLTRAGSETVPQSPPPNLDHSTKALGAGMSAARDKAVAKSNPSYIPGNPDWSYDEDSSPETLVGQTLSVHWPREARWYEGSILGYDTKTGRHQIKYLDGDTRLQRMRKFTFSIVGKPGTHMAETGIPPFKPKAASAIAGDPVWAEGKAGTAVVATADGNT